MEHIFETFAVGETELYYSCGSCGREVMVNRSPASMRVLTPGDDTVRHLGGTGLIVR